MSPRIPFKEGREQEDGGYDLLPIGRYRAKVKKATYVSKPGKTPHFALRWHVAEGPEAGKFLCFDRIMLAGKGLGPSIVKMRMMGFDVDGADDGVVDERDFFDRQAILTVEQRKWTRDDGKVQVDLQPVFDREISFGYESVGGLVAPTTEMLEAEETHADEETCVCSHPERLHKDGKACSAKACGCGAYDPTPF